MNFQSHYTPAAYQHPTYNQQPRPMRHQAPYRTRRPPRSNLNPRATPWRPSNFKSPMNWPRESSYNVPRGRKNYRQKTTEVRRIDMHNLPADLRQDMCAFARNLARNKGPYFRHHSLQERLKRYINKPSRDGTYIEVQENEVDELMNPRLLLARNDVMPVEAGFNCFGQLCKVAYTVPLSTGRILFMCIGVMDGGLKTWYVNPEFKFRTKYKCTDNRSTY